MYTNNAENVRYSVTDPEITARMSSCDVSLVQIPNILICLIDSVTKRSDINEALDW
jgi:hypothetical protein